MKAEPVTPPPTLTPRIEAPRMEESARHARDEPRPAASVTVSPPVAPPGRAVRLLAVVGLLAGGALLGAIYERVEQVQREAERANAAIDRIEAGFSAQESAAAWPESVLGPQTSLVRAVPFVFPQPVLEPQPLVEPQAPPEPHPTHDLRGAAEGEGFSLRARLRQFEGRVVLDASGDAPGCPDGTRLRVALRNEGSDEASYRRVRVQDGRFQLSETLRGLELVPQRHLVHLELVMAEQRKALRDHLRREFGLPRDSTMRIACAALALGDEGRRRATKLELRKELLRVTQDVLSAWPADESSDQLEGFRDFLARTAKEQPRYLLDPVQLERERLQGAILRARYGINDLLRLGAGGSERLEQAERELNSLLIDLMFVGSGC